MIKGIGVDIIEIGRIEQAFRRSEKFGSRVFTPRELEYCRGRKRQWASLAARFAAKEAVAKALGTGFGPIRWTDIEIVSLESGRPEVRLHRRARALAEERGIGHWLLSVSHSAGTAIAFVIAY